MRDYFQRLFYVNLVVAAGCFLAAYFFDITTPMLLVALIILFLLRFVLGKSKAERMRIWNMRREEFRRDKRLMWLSIGLNFIFPIACGAAAYFQFGYSYNNAVIWFLGVTHLTALIVNWILFPKIEEQTAAYFD